MIVMDTFPNSTSLTSTSSKSSKQYFEKFLTCPIFVFGSASQSHIYAFYVIAAILLISPLVLFYISKRKKRSPEDSYDFQLDSDNFIASLLDRAREVQVSFDLVCTRQSITCRHVTSFYVHDPSELSSSGDNSSKAKSKDKKVSPYMTLQISDMDVVKEWKEAPVDVYFQLTYREQSTLYHFASFVHRIFTHDNVNYIEIIRPSILSDSQCKEAVRIEPKPETIALASVWIFPKHGQVLPRKVSQLGKAHGSFKPEGNSDFRIVNISACGIRLRFVCDDLEKLPFPIEKHVETCILLAVNTSKQQSSKLVLWLKAECKGLVACVDKDCMDVRYSFTHWQQITERTNDITWTVATDSDRIPPLLHWIMNADENVARCQYDTSIKKAK